MDFIPVCDLGKLFNLLDPVFLQCKIMKIYSVYEN